MGSDPPQLQTRYNLVARGPCEQLWQMAALPSGLHACRCAECAAKRSYNRTRIAYKFASSSSSSFPSRSSSCRGDSGDSEHERFVFIHDATKEHRDTSNLWLIPQDTSRLFLLNARDTVITKIRTIAKSVQAIVDEAEGNLRNANDRSYVTRRMF